MDYVIGWCTYRNKILNNVTLLTILFVIDGLRILSQIKLLHCQQFYLFWYIIVLNHYPMAMKLHAIVRKITIKLHGNKNKNYNGNKITCLILVQYEFEGQHDAKNRYLCYHVVLLRHDMAFSSAFL